MRGLIAMLAIGLAACGSESTAGGPAPTAPSAASTAPSPAETGPTLEGARTALSQERYDEVCAYLETVRFSPEVCAYLADATRGTPTPLPEMTEWLRSHHVRQVRGAIVGPRPGEAESFDVLVGGEPAIMHAGFTAFEIDAVSFEFWAQQTGSRALTMADGSTRSVAEYREWSLYVALDDVTHGRPGSGPAQAKMLLTHLLDAWQSRYAAPDGSSRGAVRAPTPSVPSAPSAPPALPIAGTWFSTLSPDIRLVLTDTSYVYRFPFQGGLRRIYADIVATDTTRGHLTLRLTRVTQDDQPVQESLGTRYMRYELRGEVLYRAVAEDGFPEQLEEQMFMRIPDYAVGPDDR